MKTIQRNRTLNKNMHSIIYTAEKMGIYTSNSTLIENLEITKSQRKVLNKILINSMKNIVEYAANINTICTKQCDKK